MGSCEHACTKRDLVAKLITAIMNSKKDPFLLTVSQGFIDNKIKSYFDGKDTESN